ncbi:carbohydrate ABC transporter permease [Diplocloster agilis]|uniref:carbohydrate ABC transporter permease n=1 Tax=Diplocloster agilis TaxID=2850323 RepID=UPI000822974D|nr:carbohydrate ABC transporter permease [Suonthocola fibrivorans]MCU6732327.1 carbohydrate ABC transporter permease [Suonthocola fibrivorans]SCI43479.1 Inner membrane ABC transporter permease protein ycjP [uncultured Clostridium sp.]
MNKKKVRGSEMLASILLTALSLLVLFPIYMAVMNSLKDYGEIFQSVLSLPKRALIENYRIAFEKLSLVRSTANTVIVAGIGILGIVLAGSMAGYKLSRTKTKLSSCIFFLFVASMLVPFQAIMITLYRIAKVTGVKGSSWGLGMIYIGLGVSLAVFLFHGFVKMIPREMEESSYLDGAGEIKTFFCIIFPLLKPIIGTVVVLMFIWMWNDYLIPALMITDMKQYTIVLSVNMLFGEFSSEWPLILAALVMAFIPILVIYVIFQKNIMQGVLEGAVKG